MYVCAVESLLRRWYTGVKHINLITLKLHGRALVCCVLPYFVESASTDTGYVCRGRYVC